MKSTWKQAAQVAWAGAYVVILVGCESLSFDSGMQAASPAPDAGPTVSRERVIAELREAQRLGLTDFGEGGPKPYTAEDFERVRLAGEQADEPSHAKK